MVEPIGAGGMGEVYRARDTRLERTVAIKILAAHLSSDVERKQRFDREARAISSLQHPHICTLHDVGNENGVDYLVMEHLEGETLAHRLVRGALPTEQVLKIGMEIADALDKAHRQGVVHRDLKPGNVMLTKSGAKLLDFGLAKPTAVSVGSGTLSLAVTAPSPVSPATPVTQQGMVVGTFQYMAPEQIEGKEADARSDIFALGAVLYEMTTGKRAFEGKSQLSVASAILEKEPEPITTTQPMAPVALEHVVRTCLAKDPEERWQSAADVKRELKWIADGGSSVSAVAVPGVKRKTRERLAWAVAGAMTLAAVLLGWANVRSRRLETPPAVKRFVVSLPASQALYTGITTSLAVSPDGRYFVYRASLPSGGWQLFLHSMSELNATMLTGGEGGMNPFFSPDGAWVGFFAGGKLKKVAVSGGAAVAICDAQEGRGASWGSDGTIIFGVAAGQGLFRASANGGKVEELTRVGEGQLSHRWPEILPGGEHVLFAIQGTTVDWNAASIAVLSLKTGKMRTLLEGGTNPHYSPTGHIVFGRSDVLMAAPFDLKRLEVTGPAVPVLDDVYMNPANGNVQVALSAEGTLVYVAGTGAEAPRELVWVDRKGAAKPVGATPAGFEQPSVSPDGKKIAIHIRPPSDDIWIYDLGRGTLARLTFQPGEDESPAWSPDGKRVAFSSSLSDRPRSLLWKNADGSGTEEILATTGFHVHLGSLTHDGRLVAYTNYESETRGDIWLLPLTEERKPRPFLITPFNEIDPKISPDGRWIAYASDETGREEVYVQSLEGSGGKYQVSTDGGFGPLWARNGQELFYRKDNKVMAVTVTGQPAFAASSPRPLFEGTYDIHPRREGVWDITPDGQRFLMVRPTAQQTVQDQVHIVLNFPTEVQRRTSEAPGK
ncbi:MAG: protein kinase domain-containing protein [Terriglobales bacterium]